jgi:hypothetical protein
MSSLKLINETLDRATESKNNVTQADTEMIKDDNDCLYAFAYSTDLVQRKDPQQISYITKHMHKYFTQSVECQKIVKSFPSNTRIRDIRKRKAKDLLTSHTKLERHASFEYVLYNKGKTSAKKLITFFLL